MITKIGSVVYHTTISMDDVELLKGVFAKLKQNSEGEMCWVLPEWLEHLQFIVEHREDNR